jgi:hypothetical protein
MVKQVSGSRNQEVGIRKRELGSWRKEIDDE